MRREQAFISPAGTNAASSAATTRSPFPQKLLEKLSIKAALDFSSPGFAGFLQGNFSGSLFNLVSRFREFSREELRQMRTKYGVEIDSSYKAAMLAQLKWNEPMSISCRGERGTDRNGKAASFLLGWELPDRSFILPSKAQAKVLEGFGSLEDYLHSRAGGTQEFDAHAEFAKLASEIAVLGAGGKNSFVSVLRETFGEEIDSKFRVEFLKRNGWYDPLCIKADGTNGTEHRGKLWGSLLGLGKTQCLSDIQSAIFREVHGSHQQYVQDCHGGQLRHLISQLQESGNGHWEMVAVLRQAFPKFMGSQAEKVEAAKILGLYDPLLLDRKDKKIWSKVALACDLFGWQRKKCELSQKERVSHFQTMMLAKIHQYFSRYVDNCHDGDINKFMDVMLGQKTVLERSFLATRIRKGFVERYDIAPYKEAILRRIGWYDPVGIATMGGNNSRHHGTFIANLFGWNSLITAQRAQLMVLTEVHKSFDRYIWNCYGGNFMRYLEKLRGVRALAKKAHLNAVCRAFPKIPETESERKVIFSSLSMLDPLFFNIRRKKHKHDVCLSDSHSILKLLGLRHTRIGLRRILLERVGSFEEYRRRFHLGRQVVFRARYNELSLNSKAITRRLLWEVFYEKGGKRPEWKAHKPFLEMSEGFLNASPVPGWIGADAATKSLHFDHSLLAQARESRRGIKGIKGVYDSDSIISYSYRELLQMWLESQPLEKVNGRIRRLIHGKAMLHFHEKESAELACSAVIASLLKTEQQNQRAFLKRQLPGLSSLLESAFGKDSPHALAVLARLKKELKSNSQYMAGEAPTWPEIAKNAAHYFETARANRQKLLAGRGFELQTDVIHGKYWAKEYPIRGGPNATMMVFGGNANGVAFTIGGIEVPRTAFQLTAGAKREVEEMERVLSDTHPNIANFGFVMGERFSRSWTKPGGDGPHRANGSPGED